MKNEKESKELVKHNGQALQPIKLKSVEGYLKHLHEQPKKTEQAVNKQAGGALYVPIGISEMKLDKLTGGLWSTKNESKQIVANELLVSIEVEYFHPVAKVWLTRLGVAAVPIQQSRGASITDMDAKIKNALVKNYPAVKAQAFKNAVQSIGRTFGRDLNRSEQIEYHPFSEKVEAIAALSQCEKVNDLMDLFEDHPEWHDNDDVLEAFTRRKQELKKLGA
jgi:hypothetical protein